MIIDEEEYTFFLVQTIRPFTEVVVQDTQLSNYQNAIEVLTQKGFPLGEELRAHFNGGSLVWTETQGEWGWN